MTQQILELKAQVFDLIRVQEQDHQAMQARAQHMAALSQQIAALEAESEKAAAPETEAQ